MPSHSSTSNSRIGTESDRAQLAGHARASLIWCATALAVSPLFGGWLVDRCPLDIRFPEAAMAITSWAKANPPPNVLLLGSSRLGSFLQSGDLDAMTRRLVQDDPPVMFISVFTGGEPITLDFMTRQLLASRAEPPRLIVLETNVDLLDRNNIYFNGVVTRFMTAAELPKFAGDILLNHDGRSRLLSSRLIPFFRHRSHLLPWIDKATNGPKPSQHPTHGRLDASEHWAVLADHTADPLWEQRLNINRRHLATRFRDYQLRGATASAFEKMVARLHAHGCKIALVETPLSSTQRALITGTMQNEFAAFAQRLERSYGCELFDFSARLPDSLLLDDHHANEQGSRVFTELLTREALAPAWQQLQTETKQRVSSAHR